MCLFLYLIAPIRHGFVTALEGQDDIVIVCGDKIVRDLVVVGYLNVELAVFDHQQGFARLTRHKYIIIITVLGACVHSEGVESRGWANTHRQTHILTDCRGKWHYLGEISPFVRSANGIPN